MELVGITEVGEILGVSRQRADELSKTTGFPKPAAQPKRGRVWNRRAIERWAERRGRPLKSAP